MIDWSRYAELIVLEIIDESISSLASKDDKMVREMLSLEVTIDRYCLQSATHLYKAEIARYEGVVLILLGLAAV